MPPEAADGPGFQFTPAALEAIDAQQLNPPSSS